MEKDKALANGSCGSKVKKQEFFIKLNFARKMFSKHFAVNRSMELSKENPMGQRALLDVAIPQELKDLKRAEFVEKKRRQQLRTDCEELRQLAEHLRLAAISRDLSEQRSELLKSRDQVAVAKVESQEQAEKARLQFMAEVHEKELAHKEEQRRLRDSLVSQMELLQQRRKQECAETVADRELRMKLQHQIEKEDRAQQIHLEKEKIRKRKDMNKFIEEKHAYKEFRNKQEEDELKKVLLTQNHMEERKKQLEQERLEIRRKHEEISRHLGHQLHQLDNEKRQRETILLDLLESEYRAKDDERYRQQLEQDAIDRLRTKQELERYRLEVMQLKKQQMELRRQEIATGQDTLLKNQDAIEKDRQIAEEQRRKDYGNMLLSMIKENQRRRADAMAENVQFFNMQAKADEEQQERIQQERLEMLSNYKDALRFLPNHVLSDGDREHFGIKKKNPRERDAY